MTDDAPDTTEKIEQTERGYRLTVTSTRGTGTRDQDKVKAEAKTETVHELWAARDELVSMVEQTMDQRRAHRPDGDEDE